MDARVRKLAHNLIAHSLKLQPGEKVLIETRGLNVSLVQALVQEAYAAGGLPFVNIKNPRVDRALIEGCSQEQLQLMYKWEEERMLAKAGRRAAGYVNTGALPFLLAAVVCFAGFGVSLLL